jgi:phosphoribosylanthranilate isomerase
MNHFQIKVCGITRPDDAILSANLGADMIGILCYSKSPRFVTVAKASAIVKELPAVVDTVGVFVDSPVESVLRSATKCNLTFVQLHGTYLSRDIKTLQSEGLKVIRAFSGTASGLISSLRSSPSDLVMIDNSRGTGKAFSPSAGHIKRLPNFVLSGAISVASVRNGVKAYAPLVVDVNSSVEISPGIKSKEKLKQFFRVCNEIRYDN